MNTNNFLLGGSVLIPNEKLQEFKGNLKPLIEELPYRSLSLLKNKLFSIFKQIGIPIAEKTTYSKHWWYGFLDKNQEIKVLWEKIPRKQQNNEGSLEEESGEILINSLVEEKTHIGNEFHEGTEGTPGSLASKSSNSSEEEIDFILKEMFNQNFLSEDPFKEQKVQNQNISENFVGNFMRKDDEEIEFFINTFVFFDEMQYH